MILENTKYLFVASLDQLEEITKILGKIVIGPECYNPLEVTELGYICKTGEAGEDYVVGDFTLSSYDPDDEGCKKGIIFSYKLIKMFKEVKQL